KGLVDMDLVAVAGQLLRDGEAGRPGSHHAHAPSGWGGHLDVVGHVVAVVPVDQEALHGPNGEWLVDVGPTACLLARSAAHVAADGGARARVAGEAVALHEGTLRGQHQVTPAVRGHGAAFLALDVALRPLHSES